MLFLSLLFVGSCGDFSSESPCAENPVAKPTDESRRAAKGGGKLGDPTLVQGQLRFEPEYLEVSGVTQCEGDRIESVKLVNFGDTDEVIEKAITSCGCAKVNVPAGVVIPAGASLTVPVILKSWGGAKRKASETRIMLKEGRFGPMLSIDVENVSPIRSIPSVCQRALHEDGRIRLLSEEGESIQMLGVEPEIPYSTLETEGAEVTLFVEWEQLDEWAKSPEAKADSRVEFNEDGEWDRIELSILTDDPNCPKVVVEVLNSAYTKPSWL